jgi:hypothetical protein
VSYKVTGRSRRGRYRASTNLLQTGPRGYTALHGFGAAEEAVVETITETVGSGPSDGLRLAIAAGAVGFVGLGLLYGMSRASTSQASRYRWAGL